MNHFKAARLKIDRSKKHITDFNSATVSIPDRYVSMIEIDPQHGGISIKYDLPEEEAILANLAIIAGDAIHNLRSALDYAWVGTIERFLPGTSDRHTKFPIRETEKDIRDALNGRGIEFAVPNLFERVVFDIKPYRGGNDSLYRLHHLDIADKHELLIPVLNATVIKDLVVEDEHGEVTRGDTWAVAKRAPHFIDLPPNYHVKDKGKPTIGVLFENGLSMEHFDVVDMLEVFRVFTFQAIEMLEYL
jgi:hypothetical protein